MNKYEALLIAITTIFIIIKIIIISRSSIYYSIIFLGLSLILFLTGLFLDFYKT